ncbi:hypothetical protein IMCC21906_00456 [Spongiibacter sp. IMCC21906]|uniref:saccharopine dehydrogenase family protein n=1 Tax=Spongiibacter sp. IMCC21906 TaxID=1620392 RepID=UPI00062E0BE2|nr:saccharopine dehydrogenase NADP-binding domain-containing protein [Spongiibacter sp. IMCC21906]AKH68149.1 hypothetical protein IMCC21906_00456 [Spongiibacter sp. IMCC21906]
MTDHRYDLIVFGASSFVGKILCRYLSDIDEQPPLRWAIAGRSAEKLTALKAELGREDLPSLIADADDEVALRSLCEQSRVIVSTVGPYALYGSPLVKVCVETGTDYCDLTGEAQWIRRMLDEHEEAAKASGARIVHCCGFDSIPSDLGVLFTQQHALHRLGEYCEQINMRVFAAKGGFSGGTVASMMNLIDETKQDPTLRKKLANPYLLCHTDNATRQTNTNGPKYDEASGGWIAPFVMAAINTRVVQRSNDLLGHRYGKGFRYDEAMYTGKGVKGRFNAWSVYGGLAGVMLGSNIKPGRWLLERFLLPAPGDGPTPDQQKNGFFKLRFYGTTPAGNTIITQVSGDRDPGYGSTGKMLGQAAICLARDDLGPNAGGGFWTPASLLSDPLLARLEAHAGLEFSIQE